MLASAALTSIHANLDISLLLKAADSNESAAPRPPPHQPRSASVPSSSTQLQSPFHCPHLVMGTKRNMKSHPSESPAKKQSKWCAEEDALIIELRGKQMKWEDISKRLPGRSAISCRLHYQNYLERRSEWDEEKKNKLARLYERFKPEMWAKVAEEMAVPWRAAEAMHWQLGEVDMARRVGVIPFAFSSTSVDTVSTSSTSNKLHEQPQRQSSTSNSRRPSSYSRSQSVNGRESKHQSSCSPQSNTHGHTQGAKASKTSSRMSVRSESTPRSVPPGDAGEGIDLSTFTSIGYGHGPQLFPSVTEMTTGASPYYTPAYATSGGTYPSPGPTLPAIGTIKSSRQNLHHHRWPELYRRHSPEGEYRNMERRQ